MNSTCFVIMWTYENVSHVLISEHQLGKEAGHLNVNKRLRGI